MKVCFVKVLLIFLPTVNGKGLNKHFFLFFFQLPPTHYFEFRWVLLKNFGGHLHCCRPSVRGKHIRYPFLTYHWLWNHQDRPEKIGHILNSLEGCSSYIPSEKWQMLMPELSTYNMFESCYLMTARPSTLALQGSYAFQQGVVFVFGFRFRTFSCKLQG